ncbi:MAG: aminodeoxychorismate synthase component I [Bacteroidota bacterium]
MNKLTKEKKPFLFILDSDLKTPIVEELKNINPNQILFCLNGVSNHEQNPDAHPPKSMNLRAQIPPYISFLKKFENVQSEIRAGNTYLLNLTFQHPLDINLSLKDIFYNSQAKYKLWLKNKFVLFSPETFVKVKNKEIFTYPMKGTAEKLNENSVIELLEDKKEAAEHATITDLLRNDLGRVANNIRVTRYRYVDEIKTREKTLLQVSSEITANLFPHYYEKPGNLLNELLPAGSVTGAPKKKTVEIIKRIEDYERGFYTGVFGLFNGRDIDSAVMIRFIEKKNGNYFYKSGGGITFLSDPLKEYQEIKQKIYVPVY